MNVNLTKESKVVYIHLTNKSEMFGDPVRNNDLCRHLREVAMRFMYPCQVVLRCMYT